MANVTFGIVKFVKKLFNQSGELSGMQPLLMRTLSNLVVRPSGQTVEASLTALESTSGDGVTVYNTYSQYLADYNAGKVTDKLVVVKDETT